MTRSKNRGNLYLRTASAALFLLFTYAYLTLCQAELLAWGQHVLSEGATHYSYTLTPVVLTLLLLLLQRGIYTLAPINGVRHALTYLPSMAVLGIITSIPCDFDTTHRLSPWLWLYVPLALLYAAGIWRLRKKDCTQPADRKSAAFVLWTNIGQLLLMVLMVFATSNTDEVLHTRLRMERLMMEGKYAEALRTNARSRHTDASLTTLRMACMSQTHTLAERLFAYPLKKKNKDALIDGRQVKTLMWTPPRWLKTDCQESENSSNGLKVPVDYRLCNLLIDKNIGVFVKELQHHYNIGHDTLPRHYAEALILYRHLHAAPQVNYANPVAEADFQDFQQVAHKYGDIRQQAAALKGSYGNTYWYYYKMEKWKD